MAYHFRNLVFEGGGMKGIAYVGALEALGRRGILRDIVRVGGTSAGAINASLFALGFSNSETRSFLNELDFRNFLDDDWGVLRDTQRLISIYQGSTPGLLVFGAIQQFPDICFNHSITNIAGQSLSAFI